MHAEAGRGAQIEGPRREEGVGVVCELPAEGSQGGVQVVGAAVMRVLQDMCQWVS